MDADSPILIVGAGVFGLSAACALAERGHTRVTVLERGHPGSGATARAAGILSVQTWNDADMALIRRTRDIAESLAAWGETEGLLASRGAWRRVGGLTIGSHKQAAHLEDVLARMRRFGESGDVLDAGDARKRFPAFNFADDETVLFGEGDGYLEAGDLADLLAHRARHLGVEIRVSAGIDTVETTDEAVTGVRLADGTRAASACVVLAAGAWTSRLAAAAGAPIAALAYRTQLASLALPGIASFPVMHDAVHHFYARPESTSRFFAGDGTELRPFDPDAYDATASPAFIEDTCRRVIARFARAADVTYHHGFAGLCVGSPDRRPLVGATPSVRGLYVMTGDNGFGLMRGPALGEVLASVVRGESHPLAAKLDPARFGSEPPQSFPLTEGYAIAD